MAKAVIHSYPFYISDWRMSDARLELDETARLLYREVLDQCYLEGFVCDDLRKLAYFSGMREASVKRAWPHVKDQLKEVEPGKFTHPRVEEIRPKLLDWREQKRAAGKASAATKAERSLNGRSTGVETLVQRAFQRTNQPPSSSSSSSSSTTSLSAAVDAEDFVSRFMNQHPSGKRDQGAVERYIPTLLDHPKFDAETILRRHREFIDRLDNPRFCPMASKWLADGQWLDEGLDAQPAALAYTSTGGDSDLD